MVCTGRIVCSAGGNRTSDHLTVVCQQLGRTLHKCPSLELFPYCIQPLLMITPFVMASIIGQRETLQLI